MGYPTCYWTGTEMPDFKSKISNDSDFKADKLFDWTEGRKKENYLSVVHHDESYSAEQLSSRKLQTYEMLEDFFICFCTKLTEPAQLDLYAASIPHSGKMRKIIVS